MILQHELTRPLAKLVSGAQAVGYHFEPAHQQFFHLKGTGRWYAVFINERGGFDRAYRYQGEHLTGEYTTLKALRRDLLGALS